MADKHPVPSALASYIARIGAVRRSFKKWQVAEQIGAYPAILATITVDRKGNIFCTNPQYAPTEDEQKATAEQFKAEPPDWPKHVPATTAAGCPAKGSTYPIVRQQDGAILMIQELTVLEDGSKVYAPWTQWSDGEWRCMEPEGDLPFWKPDTRMSDRIMVHEGAKCAKHAHDLVHSGEAKYKEMRKKHPWVEDLARYEHWGMLGGAVSPHRADWDELRKRDCKEVVYFCDNDEAGHNALEKVSRLYGKSLKGVRVLGDAWKIGWDIADDMPEEFFDEDGKWTGPHFHELLVFATYATKPVYNPETKRFNYHLTDAFAREWYHSSSPKAFIHKDWPNTIRGEKQFNHAVRPFSDVKETSELLIRRAASGGGDLVYDPSQRPGIVSVSGGQPCVNTHVPCKIPPLKGDESPFMEYLEHILPLEEDRNYVKRWCATLIARPDLRMQYALLLASNEQGIGKSTLGEHILAPLVGMDNVSFPKEQDIVDSSFNGWCAHKRLAVVHEIYAGHGSKAYDRLKSVITDGRLDVNKKFMEPYTIHNYIHVFACSNSDKPILIADNDRRWLVPKVTATKRDKTYWDDLHAWLKAGGLGIIRQWAIDYVQDPANVVTPGEAAPETRAKQHMVDVGLSPGAEWVAELIEDMKADFKGVPMAVTDRQMIDCYVRYAHNGIPPKIVEKTSTIRRVMESRGWTSIDGRIFDRRWKQAGQTTRILVNTEEDARLTSAEVIEKYKEPFDLDGFLSQDESM